MIDRPQEINVALLVLLSIVTLGIYVPFWYKKQKAGLNNLNSKTKIGILPNVLLIAIVICLILSIIAAAIVLNFKAETDSMLDKTKADPTRALTDDELQVLLSIEDTQSQVFMLQTARDLVALIVSIICLILAFSVRRILIDHYGTGQFFMEVSGFLTFIFTLFYLQYKINNLPVGTPLMAKTDEEQKKEDALRAKGYRLN